MDAEAAEAHRDVSYAKNKYVPKHVGKMIPLDEGIELYIGQKSKFDIIQNARESHPDC